MNHSAGLGNARNARDWNTFIEEIIETSNAKKKASVYKGALSYTKIKDISATEEERIKTQINEFDRVLGGGLMPGSVILLGGDPGIGKSTLAMQSASNIKEKVLYVTGEESTKQIKIRANRLKINSDNFFILAETDLSPIIASINELQPSVVIIDSIQTMYRGELDNSPGTVTQIRECTSLLMDEAKKKHFCVIISRTCNKRRNDCRTENSGAHCDTVIQFEGESHHSFRILRAQKNRFGSTNEIGIFEMHEDGLTEVINPSELIFK